MSYREIKIGKLCLPTEQRDPRPVPETSFEYIDISSIDRDQKMITATNTILGKDAPSRARKVVQSGDVLVSTVRPNLNAVAIVPPKLDGHIASTGFCVLRPNSKILDNHYLYYRTLTSEFIEYLTARMRGANYPAVTDGVVKDALIPLPPLSEQRRIMEILDQADALRKKRAEADAEAERILPALFYKMFGDPAMNSRDWKIVEMKEIVAETRNGLYKHGDYYGRGTQILKMFNIQNGELNLERIDLVEVDDEEFENYKLGVGDILLNRVNTPELVGKCAVITPELGRAIFESKNIRIRIKRNLADPDYVAHYLNRPFGHAALRQGVKHAIGMATINNSDLRTILIPLPLWSNKKHGARPCDNLGAYEKTEMLQRKSLIHFFLIFSIALSPAILPPNGEKRT